MQVTPAYLSSVATFYDMLRTQPTGPRYVYVCTSVACHLRNAKSVYDAIAEEARDQGLEGVEVREFECLGACDMAPMASVDGRYVGPLDDSDAHELVAAIREQRTILPGRGLEDSDYKLPWATESPAGRSHPRPPQPDVSPEGGDVKDRRQGRARGPMTTETRVLLDEHRRARPPQARGLRAPGRLQGPAQGAVRHGPRGGAHPARGVRAAGPRRRRLLHGQEGQLHPQGHDGQVPLLQRRRVRAGHVQGPAADAEEPPPADRGLHHRLDRRGGQQGLHLHPGRVLAPGRHPRGRRGGDLRQGLPGRRHPRLRARLRPRGPPRRGRLHLRRGVRPARRAGGQARQPAPEAAVPRQPGPLPGARR